MISEKWLTLLSRDPPEKVVGQHRIVQKSFSEACHEKGFPFMDHSFLVE
jgi:hypothetical protein